MSEIPFFLTRSEGFGSCSARDDFLHPEASAKQPGDSLHESQYFGLSVPEHAIHGLLYCWHHPNLKVVSGGAWVWQGIKKHHLACELFDMRSFMSDKVIEGDLHDYTFENSYRVQVLEPMQRLRARYSDPARGNAFDVEYTALAPGVMHHNGLHFEQGMRVQGELLLDNRRYDVDSYTVRDRSWGALRPEAHVKMAPMSWLTGVFDQNFFFNITGFDHPDLNPDSKGFLDLPADSVLKAGWIYRDGKLVDVIECRKITQREPERLFPEWVKMDLVDSQGRRYSLKGTVIAASNWSPCLNRDSTICLVRWECDGRVGYGDLQDAKWHDYYKVKLR